MKCVFVCEQCLTVYLANGKLVSVKQWGRPIYQYKEKPSSTSETHTGEDAWKVLLHHLYMSDGYKNILNKRLYISSCDIGKTVYKDQIEKIVSTKDYNLVKNPSIKILQEDLGFDGYTEKFIQIKLQKGVNLMNDCKYCNIGVGSEYEAGHSLQIENVETINGGKLDVVENMDIRAVISEDYDYNKFINISTRAGDFIVLAKYCPECGREL